MIGDKRNLLGESVVWGEALTVWRRGRTVLCAGVGRTE